tara:strand:+ start:3050 stop:3325 length:276 start_codon:yes stop_codon:yes gene_type:complete
MEVLQTAIFRKKIKKLHANEKKLLDKAVRSILNNPNIGESKKGDLAHIYIYKYKMISALTLIAYEFSDARLILLNIGTHENFYKELKNQRN